MKFSLFTNYGALNSAPVFAAFESSLKNKNYQVAFNDLQADVAVIWSVLWKGRMQQNQAVWNHFRTNNKPVIVLEVGNFVRGKTWKVGLNGIGKNCYAVPSCLDCNRPAKLDLKLSNWKDTGEFVLICGQQDQSLQWSNQPPAAVWFNETIKLVQSYSKRPILIRPHPRCKLPDIEKSFKNVYRQEPVHLSNTYDQFDLNFKNVHATISWNSNPGINSIISGVPAFVGPDSLAYDVANTSLELINTPAKPLRDQWLIKISHTEYTIDEISSGLILQNLTENLNCVNFKR